MQKHLFIYGSADECTERIKKSLGAALAGAGGYFIDPVKDADGNIRALELVPAAALAGVEGYERMRFLDLSSSPPVRDNDVFRRAAAGILWESEYFPFSLVCGLGGFELVIPEYRAALGEFLSLPLPCVGTLITEEHAEELRRLLGLGERYSALYRRLRTALENDADTLVTEYGGAEEALSEWKKEYVL